VYNPPETFPARQRRAARHNRRWHHQLRSAKHFFRDHFRSPEKLEKNRQIFRNPNADTTLRPDEYYSFTAHDYTQTHADASAARPA
jgi:hypothetical protein